MWSVSNHLRLWQDPDQLVMPNLETSLPTAESEGKTDSPKEYPLHMDRKEAIGATLTGSERVGAERVENCVRRFWFSDCLCGNCC